MCVSPIPLQPMLNKEAVAEAGMQLHRAMKGPHVTVVVGHAGENQ